MEAEINIVEILKDKPQGTKLYSSACGKCKLEEVDDKSFKISFYSSKFGFMNGGEGYLDKNGKLYDDGECVVFPSKEMRDWSKFQWKKGDVLVSNDGGTEVIFDKWYDDTYTNFYSKHYLNSEDENNIKYNEAFLCTTERYSLVDKDTAQTYINTIEKRLGGKLNLETLEIEKQLEFKDGDIVTMHKENCDTVSIFSRLKAEGSFYYYAFHAIQTNNTGVMDCYTTLPRAWTFFEGKMNFATDSEKQQLFDALAKEGKAWDAEKKQIVDLMPKVELKPFDNVLVRHQKTEEWRANIFSHTDKTDEYLDYVCVNGRWEFCIPYEGNESLLGTTKDVEVSYGRSF